MSDFFVWTDHGYVVRIGAADGNAAMRGVRAQATYGLPLQVMDAEQWKRYTRVPDTHCTRCWERKDLCGGWCAIPEAND